MKNVTNEFIIKGVPLKKYKFVSDLPLYEAYYKNILLELEKKVKKAEKKAAKKILLLQQKVEAGLLAKQEADLQIKHQKRLKVIENLLRRGDTIESIAELLVSSIEEITALVAQIQNKKP